MTITASTTFLGADPGRTGQWLWLEARADLRSRQLWVKGRKLLASTVWLDAITNGMNSSQAAENWDLAETACDEIFAYFESQRSLIEAENHERRERLRQARLEVEVL